MASRVPKNKDLQKEKHLNVLRGVIVSAVHHRYDHVINRALEAIREHKLDEKKPSKNGVRPGKQVLDFLPPQDAKMKVPDKHISHSPLMLACEMNDIDRVKLLLSKEASAAFKNKEGLNALHIACNKGNFDICKLILDKAGSQNNFGKKQYSNDLPILVKAKEKRGWTPMMYAVKGDHVEIVKELMTRENTGVDYLMGNKKGANLIHIACSEGNVRCLQHFIANPPPMITPELRRLFMATDKKQWNLLHHACSVKAEIEDKTVVQWLLENVPESILTEEDKTFLLNQKTSAGYTPLLTACDYQKEDAVKYLTGRPDVNVSDYAETLSEDGEERTGRKSTGLHLAAIHDSKKIAEILIEKGCKIDHQDLEGNTALHVARKKSSDDVATLLVQDGRLNDVKNSDGELSSEIEPEDVIPPEIIKRGPEVVDRYRHALRHGKEKIPRCGLLILGEERKGKTSLYKLLVGLDFDPEQDPTRGIDNNEVDTVDEREVTMDWSERGEEDQRKEREESHTNAVIKELPPHQQTSKERVSNFEKKTGGQLILLIDSVVSKIAQEKIRPPKPEPKVHSMPFNPLGPAKSFGNDLTLSYKKTTGKNPLASPPVVSKPPPVDKKVPSRADVIEDVKESPSISPPKPKVPRLLSPQKAESAPLPVSESQSPPVKRSVSAGTTRKEAQNLNKALKQQKREKKEPSLSLNTLDFAGQKTYRPMHHCFIRRRAMYLVIFNLQDMFKYVQSPGQPGDPNPVEEVRYWLHSIHAHIYPPDQTEDTRENDERHRRVCLVGTHRDSGRVLTVSDIDKINVALKKLIKDNRCVNHIHRASKDCLFFTVENSLGRGDEKSGAKPLQDQLISISRRLEFLHEKYPISWLRLDTHLVQRKNDHTQPKCCLESDLQKEAERKGVNNPDDALTFFHDTGKLILLRKVTALFLGESGKQEISNLAIVDPKWLMSAMQIIMELSEDQNDTRATGIEWRQLTEKGEVSIGLLRRLWSQGQLLVQEDGLVDTKKLCFILQAYCLLYPIECEETPRTESEQCYLIPSLLPKGDDSERSAEAADYLPWITFYFDFQTFLPLEIYHRLVCMFLVSAQKASGSVQHPFLSKTLCRFNSVRNCNWKIELEASEHRIKVSVVMPDPPEEPSQYLKTVHREYLEKICIMSDLQGLRYHGGPFSGCRCPSSVLECVSYDAEKDCPDEDDCITLESACPNCLKKQTVDEILKQQVIDHYPIKPTSKGIPELTVKNLTVELKDLTEVKTFGALLNIPPSELTVITKDNRNNTYDQKFALFNFIQQNSKSLDITWAKIALALEEPGISLGDLAMQIRKKYCPEQAASEPTSTPSQS